MREKTCCVLRNSWRMTTDRRRTIISNCCGMHAPQMGGHKNYRVPKKLRNKVARCPPPHSYTYTHALDGPRPYKTQESDPLRVRIHSFDPFKMRWILKNLYQHPIIGLIAKLDRVGWANARREIDFFRRDQWGTSLASVQTHTQRPKRTLSAGAPTLGDIHSGPAH